MQTNMVRPEIFTFCYYSRTRIAARTHAISDHVRPECVYADTHVRVHVAIGAPRELLDALMASIDYIEAGTEDQNSRQTFIDDTLDDTSDQKSRPERLKPSKGAATLGPVHTTWTLPRWACAHHVDSG